MFKGNTKNTRTTLDYAKNIRPLLLRVYWDEGQLSHGKAISELQSSMTKTG